MKSDILDSNPWQAASSMTGVCRTPSATPGLLNICFNNESTLVLFSSCCYQIREFKWFAVYRFMVCQWISRPEGSFTLAALMINSFYMHAFDMVSHIFLLLVGSTFPQTFHSYFPLSNNFHHICDGIIKVPVVCLSSYKCVGNDLNGGWFITFVLRMQPIFFGNLP